VIGAEQCISYDQMAGRIIADAQRHFDRLYPPVPRKQLDEVSMDLLAGVVIRLLVCVQVLQARIDRLNDSSPGKRRGRPAEASAKAGDPPIVPL